MRSSLLLLCAFIAAAAGCTTTGAPHTPAARAPIDATDPSHPPINANCTEQLKRSLLCPADAQLSTPPTMINSHVSVSGKLLRFDREWIVLDSAAMDPEGKIIWVPQENVLLLQFARE